MDIDDNWRPGNIFSAIKWKLSCIYQHLDLARQGRPDHMYVTYTGAQVSYRVYISIWTWPDKADLITCMPPTLELR